MNYRKISYEDLVRARRIDFYRNFNYNYFSRKTTYLIALLAKKDQLDSMLVDIPKYGALQIGIKVQNIDPKEYVHDLELEVHMTLFLALETLFRIFFAVLMHPGYEHIFLKQFDSIEFADYFHRFFIKKDPKSVLPSFTSMKDLVHTVFFLGVDLDKTFGKEEADKRISNVMSYLDRFAERFDKRSVYNAYKHTSLDFRQATYEPGGISFDGFSLMDNRGNGMSTFEYPTAEEIASGNFEVKELITLMTPDCSAMETIIATYLLQNLIEARKFQLNLTSKEDYQKAIYSFPHGAHILNKKGVRIDTFEIKDSFSGMI